MKIVHIVLSILVALVLIALGYRYRRAIRSKTTQYTGIAVKWLKNE
jgi:hypothetical protein